MTSPQIIRIEAVDFDFVQCCVEGTAVCRQANGVMTRRRIRVPANPNWSYGEAVEALTQQTSTT